MMKDRLANSSYKYNSAHDWLSDYVNRQYMPELHKIINKLMAHVDPDDIQFEFQDQMAADGYFDPIY